MATRYKVRLHLEGIGTWEATVDGRNRWRLPDGAGMNEEATRYMEEAIGGMVAGSLMTDPPGYMPVHDMRYAIQAVRAFPGTELLTPLPPIETGRGALLMATPLGTAQGRIEFNTRPAEASLRTLDRTMKQIAKRSCTGFQAESCAGMQSISLANSAPPARLHGGFGAALSRSTRAAGSTGSSMTGATGPRLLADITPIQSWPAAWCSRQAPPG